MKAGKSLLLPLLVIFILAFVVRIFPAVWSPYPYNIDGLGEANFSQSIYRTGGLATPLDAGYWDSYILKMPFLDVIIATVSSLSGTEPLLLAQSIIAVIGAMSCVAGALVVHMITESRRASVLAGMFLALLGTYVFCTTSAWKEALGLTMMIVIAGLFLKRDDIRIRILLTMALLMMTFVHHHSATITYLFFIIAASGEAFLAWRKRQWSWKNSADILTGVSLFVLAEIYYSDIELPYYDFIKPETDLYLLIAVLVAMIMLMFALLSGSRAAAKRQYLKIVIPVGAIALLLLTYFRSLFTGIPTTESPVLMFGTAYVLLAVPMWFGAGRMLGSDQKSTPMILAAILAPLTMISFAFLRGLDPTSHMIVYRTFDFLDLAMAILFAGGVLILLKNLRKAVPVLVIILLMILAATAPLAFQTQELFGVQNQTYSYEVDSYRILKSLSNVTTFDSDQRIGTSVGLLENFSHGTDLAYRIDTGRTTSGYHWLVVEKSWTTTGAQEFPFGRRVLDEQQLTDFLNEKNVILIAGPCENQLVAATNPN
jgi:hypothetical protein